MTSDASTLPYWKGQTLGHWQSSGQQFVLWAVLHLISLYLEKREQTPIQPNSGRRICHNKNLGTVEGTKSTGEVMSDQEISQSGQSPSQPSTSGHLQVVVDDEVAGPSGEGARTAGQKRKRESSSESDEELEELDSELNHPWDVDSLCGLKMKLKKRRMDLVLPEHHEVFKRLLEDPVVKRFLAWDKNLRVSDKYLLSMVIAYFSRAGLFSWQYQRIHFFLALYLASDMEEDNQAPKQDIFYFLYGKSYALRPLFHKLRYQFICSMGWNTRVSLEECEEVDLYVWSLIYIYVCIDTSNNCKLWFMLQEVYKMT
uniref:Speedy protein E4-like n=1 Tax=Sciurus vulgaris TaxID=55149 RepID=A0A8D2DU74_SCIVU